STYSITGIAALFSGAARHVAGYQVTESRVTTFQIIISFVFRNIVGSAVIVFLFRNPDATVISERFRHQCQFRLMIATYRNTGWVDLSKAGIAKIGTFFMSFPCGSNITTHGVS